MPYQMITLHQKITFSYHIPEKHIPIPYTTYIPVYYILILHHILSNIPETVTFQYHMVNNLHFHTNATYILSVAINSYGLVSRMFNSIFMAQNLRFIFKKIAKKTS